MKQPTILLMDEDAETLEQLQTMLQREQYHVLAAVDGHAALRLARTAHPNLIVSDVMLAGLDGYEVWKILRMDKETSHIPVLVTSALTIPSSNEPWRPTPDTEWQFLYYDAFLPKPIDLPRFMRVVEKLLNPDETSTIPDGPSVILAVEDEQTRRDLAELLHNHDFGVKTSDSLGEVLRKARAVPPAALILDSRIPDPGVKKTIIQINKLVPTTVIVLIVDPQSEFDIELQEHCDGFIMPPVNSVHTITTLNRILDFCSMHRRMQGLSTELIVTSRNLRDNQQMLNAQNKELAYINNQLRELDTLKEMFSGMVVHDLKSPLASILGALSFLQGDIKSDDEAHPYLLKGSIAAGNQMLRMIETLLERQRLADGHQRPDSEPLDLSRIIDACLQQITSLLALHNLYVRREITDKLPLVYADSGMSQRILENLFDNAIKFSPKGGTITVKAIPVDGFVKVSVADNGPGISKEHQEIIFDRFAQLENEPISTSRGFGMGLTFCSLATQAMDGSIWVESDGVSGTTFYFTLPIYKDEV